jgi:hypothetical protein
MNTFLWTLIGGALGMGVILAAALTGLKVIKAKFKTHKALGIAALSLGIIHGLGGLLLYLGII